MRQPTPRQIECLAAHVAAGASEVAQMCHLRHLTHLTSRPPA
jgi:hypothetical protein